MIFVNMFQGLCKSRYYLLFGRILIKVVLLGFVIFVLEERRVSDTLYSAILTFFLIISFVPVMSKKTPESSFTVEKCRAVLLIILVVLLMLILPGLFLFFEYNREGEHSFIGPALILCEVSLIIVWRLSRLVYRDELVPDGRIKVLETNEKDDVDNILVQ